ncbi:hypothetical protein BOX15_Mlig002299g1 [Macrostomum lignano]|uniref:UspA domain-containing protein n=1 Tax=Macrostomum lignano TaxID=282301 RepID=A0A267G7L3_9PLAT|nr:hypothetical protein BOX15_Mlig002299g1 [Macrostomum lignano]
MSSGPRTVLIAVDESDHSRQAFRWFVSELFRPDDRVIVYHSAEAPSLPNVTMSSPISVPVDDWHRILMSRLEAMRALEDEYTVRARDADIRNFQFVAENSRHPGEAIVEASNRFNVSHIVIGCRGLGSLRRAFLGSVSDYVARNAFVPTSIVPAACGGDRE